MSDTLTLAAETRDQVGKGASRSLRREGRVPAVIYGQNKAAASIHLEEKALVKALMTGHFFTSVIMVDGQRTLAKSMRPSQSPCPSYSPTKTRAASSRAAC
jgi:large subunit ribosomal protein L25